jgi:hypothetical protein
VWELGELYEDNVPNTFVVENVNDKGDITIVWEGIKKLYQKFNNDNI